MAAAICGGFGPMEPMPDIPTNWLFVSDGTFVKRVPGGMVMRSSCGDGVALCFIPCNPRQMASWLEDNNASMPRK